MTEALKQRYNIGRGQQPLFLPGLEPKRGRSRAEKSSGLYGIEIKSAMTYRTDFEKALKQMDNWIKEPIAGKTVVYAGTLSENTAGEIKLLNYAHLDDVPE